MKSRTLGTALLAGLTLLGTGGATGFLLRPASAPQSLRTATEVTSAPVGREELVDERTVKVSLTKSPAPPLVVGFAGRVTSTSCRPGTPLRSGRAVARIDNTPLIALATSVPLYRDLDRGDRGGDVRALQRELARLGHRVNTDGRYDRGTAEAVRKLQKAAGVSRPDGRITATEILWLPAASVSPDSCELVQGGYVSSGQTYAKVAPRLTAVVVESMPSGAVAGKRVIELMGVIGPLDTDGTATDPKFLAKVAGTQEYRLAQRADEEPELTAVLALADALPTLKVPPGALFGVDGDTGCVQSGDRAHAVTIVGSKLGATLVAPAGDRPTGDLPADGDLPAQVNLGSSITLDSCG
ncbi:hypothetical protein GCM10022225_33640 [Plantactinospora mayteni]|uniref:Peptidoglycan binding-like domain-containing protein n=1 Tax=Plantactinospora mayteni TaxID=566021 RepID=A0ABQ4EL57_9ACTN|nr:peptidoglycan-binding domain-containing protein [Plantactinospora mayteni]GIG95472.1 hypothetical protein Pma05_20450 [Plantactinospora mayteni]